MNIFRTTLLSMFIMSIVAPLVEQYFDYWAMSDLGTFCILAMSLVVYIEYRIARPFDAGIKTAQDIAILHARVEQSTLAKHELQTALLREKVQSEKDYQNRLRLDALARGIHLPD